MSPTPLRARGGRPFQGFSLIELLVVIVIVGVMAAVAIPFIAGVNGNTSDIRDRRNAQNLVQVFAAGENAGADFLVPGDLDATIKNVVAGVMVEEGVFDGQEFSVPGLDQHARSNAARYLALESGQLFYRPNG